jgi:hypothetical protein
MQRFFLLLCLAALLGSGCVAKGDYLQKQAEADALNMNQRSG